MAICCGPSDFIRSVHEEGEGGEASQLFGLDVIVMSAVVLSRSLVRLRFISLRSICILAEPIVLLLSSCICRRSVCTMAPPCEQLTMSSNLIRAIFLCCRKEWRLSPGQVRC